MREILRHAHFAPPDAARVGAAGFPGFRAMNDSQEEASFAIVVQVNEIRCAAIDARIFLQTPTSKMMTDRDHTRLDPFGDPHAINKVADLRIHAGKICGQSSMVYGWCDLGSFTKKINMPIITMESTIEIENVGMNPVESTIQPPRRGAMMVAGAVSVCESPM